MNLSTLWHDLVGRRHESDHAGTAGPDNLVLQVGAAQREWQAAQQYFQSVSDPQLVDHAVHAMIAAEHKYMSLLRKLKESRNQGE